MTHPISISIRATQSPHRFSATFLASLMLVIMAGNSEAQLQYNFEQQGTGIVLATLELSSLPATHTEVVELTFSSTGQSIFGYPAIFPGTFELTFMTIVEDGIGGLGELEGAELWDFDAPRPSTHPMGGTSLVNLQFWSTVGFDSIDVTDDRPGFIDYDIGVNGDWRLVPEPSSFAMCLLGAFFVSRWTVRRCYPRPVTQLRT